MRPWSLVAAGVAVLCLVPTVVRWWPSARVHVEPGRLRALILASVDQPYQGYVDSVGGITLPNLPQIRDVAGLFGGSTSLRVWYAARQAWRVAVLDPVGEQDIDLTPPDLARRLVGGASAGDRVEAIASRRVAGVSAAGLRLTPADPATTVGRVDVWADPRTGLPLEVHVSGRGAATAVLRSRFMDVNQRRPGSRVLTPSVADLSHFGTTTLPDVLAEINAETPELLPPILAGRARVPDPAGVAGIAAFGTGLSRFVVLPLPARLGQQSLSAVRDGGGTAVTLADAQAYTVAAGVATTLVVRTGGPRGSRRSYLLAGLVTPGLLTQAAADLVAARPAGR